MHTTCLFPLAAASFKYMLQGAGTDLAWVGVAHLCPLLWVAGALEAVVGPSAAVAAPLAVVVGPLVAVVAGVEDSVAVVVALLVSSCLLAG